MPKDTRKLNILFLCEGAGFAGAESYALNLIRKISQLEIANCFVATFYNGLLKFHLEKEAIAATTLHGRNNIKSIASIIKLVRQKNIDVIHCVDLKSTLIGGVASIFIRKVKTVSTLHGLPESYDTIIRQCKYLCSLFIYYLLLTFHIDGKICVSEDLNKKLKHIRGSKHTIVIHNGIEVDQDNVDGGSRITDKSKYIIGTVGRLDKVKGHEYLLDAAGMIIEERDDVIFQIIGTGPLEGQLKQKAEKLGLADHICFLGFRPDAIALIAAMDIFVLPSLHEGIPYVLLEAMAESKPVICSAVGGVKEIITNQGEGILVGPKDSNALSNAIMGTLDNKKLLHSMGRKARQRIVGNFSSELMAKKTYNFYRQLV